MPSDKNQRAAKMAAASGKAGTSKPAAKKPAGDRAAKIAAAGPTKQPVSKAVWGLAALAVAIVLVVVVVINNRGSGGGSASPSGTIPGSGSSTTSQVKLPKGVESVEGGLVAYPGKAKAGAPTLQIFEDFQCSGCEAFEKKLGPTVREMAAAGDIKLVYYIRTFLDDKIGNDSSMKAGNAAMCASDAGKFAEFHDAMYANWPEEGKGYSDEMLNAGAAKAGITGAALDTWKQCVSAKPYVPYLKTTEDTTARWGVTSTPSIFLNNKVFDMKQTSDAATFKAAVLAAK